MVFGNFILLGFNISKETGNSQETTIPKKQAVYESTSKTKIFE